MEKLPIENWNSSRVRAAEAMIRSMEAHMRLLEKQRDFLSVWKADKVRSLETHVKELERQRDFLTLWKPDLYSGADIEGSHVDVQLQASDGSSVHAHKAVLAAKSTEFESLLWGNAKDNTVEMSDMSHEVLSAFVSFFYTASVDADVLVKHTASLLRAADKYKVDFLRSVCEEALVTNICKENAISLFVVAKKHCSEAVLEAVLKEATSMGELSTFNEYKQFSQSDAGLLLELYERLSELKKSKSSKKRRAAKEASAGSLFSSPEMGSGLFPGAEMCSGEPLGDIVSTNFFEGINGKVEKEEGQGEDSEKGSEDKEKQLKVEGGKKRSKEDKGLGRPIQFDTPMMPGPPYGVPPFMPPFMPPYMPPMYHGNPMHPFFGGQRPTMAAPVEPPMTQGKPSGAKRDAQTKRTLVSIKKADDETSEVSLPHGVMMTKKKLFKASIIVNGKNHVLGTCKTQEEAGHLYDRAAYVCGRETNLELPEKEKQELEGLLWEEFLGFPTESELEETYNMAATITFPAYKYDLQQEGKERGKGRGILSLEYPRHSYRNLGWRKIASDTPSRAWDLGRRLKTASLVALLSLCFLLGTGEPDDEPRKKPKKKKGREEPCFYQGVTKIPGNGGSQWWKARIGRQGKHFYLGTCKNKEEAARLYDRASYLCGSEPANFELSEAERKELDETKWEDFVVACRQTYKRRQFKRLTPGLPLPTTSLA